MLDAKRQKCSFGHGLSPWDDAHTTQDSQDTALAAGINLSPHLLSKR